MATKLPRLNVTFPVDLFETIQKEAAINFRSDSSQVVWILTQYYMDRRREADLFTLPQLHEAKRAEIPHFADAPLVPEQVSKSRNSGGQEKS